MMSKGQGTYALILEAESDFEVRVGKLGRLCGRPGYYVYVGSAFGPGGVKARVGHHRRTTRRPRWHIDYLRRSLPFNEVWYTHDAHRREHAWACALTRMPGATIPLVGFGASDCACTTHLIYFERPPAFQTFRKRLASCAVKHAPVRKVSFENLARL
jgi:Uri superfamily endonuclease